jgi:hypothetical protein
VLRGLLISFTLGENQKNGGNQQSKIEMLKWKNVAACGILNKNCIITPHAELLYIYDTCYWSNHSVWCCDLRLVPVAFGIMVSFEVSSHK